jgi:hypothetical protein
MEFELANEIQHHIADLLWEAEDDDTVKDIIREYGVDAYIVFDMMMAAHFDTCMDTDVAESILERFMNK